MNKYLLRLLVGMLLLAAPASVAGQTEQKAKVAFDQGDYEAAANLYNMAADRATDKEKASSLRTRASIAENAKRLRSEADYAWNHGYYSTAQEKYKELLKLNPNDPQAIYREKEVNYKVALSKAMQWYNAREYELAMTYFEKAGPRSEWSQAELQAYASCREAVDYATFNSATSSSKEDKALSYLTRNPKGAHATEIRNWLFEYYMAGDNPYLAGPYATTDDQQKRLSKATKKRSGRSRSRSSSNLFDETSIGIALETAPLSKLPEIAIPVELRLLKPESTINICLGARIGNRGQVFDNYDIFTGDDSIEYAVEQHMAYWQFAPYVKVSLLALDIFYFSYNVRMNVNFGHKYREERSLYVKDGTNTFLHKETYRPSGALDPVSFTGTFEFGLGDKDFALYLYYSSEFSRPMSDETIRSITGNPGHPMYDALGKTDLLESYTKTGFLGIGFRVYM